MVKVTGRQKLQETVAYLAYMFTCGRWLQTTRPNPLLDLIYCRCLTDAWQLDGRLNIMSALGANMCTCYIIYALCKRALLFARKCRSSSNVVKYVGLGPF